MKNDYYTYAYLRENGTPYYIGKGRGKRAFCDGGRCCKKPPRERILLLKTNLTEEEAFRHEVYMIAVLGRKDLGTGLLLNFTDGGDGASNPAQKVRQKMSAAKIGSKHSNETRQKMSQSHKGKVKTEEHRKNLSLAHLGKKMSVEARQKMSLANVRRGGKKIEILFPDGRVGLYPSYGMATQALGFGRDAIRRMMRDGRTITRGKYKGIKARYL